MAPAPFVLALTLLTPVLFQQAAPALPGQLRWVRGVVSVASPASVVINFGDRSVTLAIDGSTRMLATPAVGGVIEAHYTERQPDFHAALLVDAPGTGLSKRPGRSYRGTVTRVNRSTLSLRVDGKRRDIQLSRELRAVASRLAIGEEVLVTYEEVSDDMPAGDIVIPGTAYRGLEIRKLGS